jgi:hypothetical protein
MPLPHKRLRPKHLVFPKGKGRRSYERPRKLEHNSQSNLRKQFKLVGPVATCGRSAFDRGLIQVKINDAQFIQRIQVGRLGERVEELDVALGQRLGCEWRVVRGN